MTNEEKAKEILCNNCTCVNVCRKEEYRTPCEKYKCAIQAMQWKDEQWKQRLEKIFNGIWRASISIENLSYKRGTTIKFEKAE